MTQSITRGSEWRKWDLHFHTPSSYDYQNKSVTNQQIIDTLVDNCIEVVAVTDHHVIDIPRIQELQKLSAGKVTILPGIEFRAELGGSESLHYIGIFPENSDIEYIWTNIQAKCKLTPKDITDIGGDANIHCDFKETCQIIHDLGGIVTVHAGGKSNSIESIKNNHEFKKELKRDLVENHIDIFELGQEGDQEDYNSIVFPAIKMRIPMIICSDNHNINSYKLKQNLWIKGDSNFEGLQQIIYEPTERVYIGEHKPDQKVTYQTIDRIEFIDSNSSSKVFNSEPILFNPNLNAVIGSRSSGKSALLLYMANSVLPEFIIEEGIEGPGAGKKWSDVSNITCKVFWSNGMENALSPGKVIYIPQGHLVKISNPIELKEKIIPIIEEKFEGKFNIYKDGLVEVSEINKGISSDLFDYFGHKISISELNKANQGIGSIESIEKVITEKDEQIKKLNINSLSPQEIEEYREYHKSITELKEKEKKYDKILNELRDFDGEKILITLSGLGIPLYGVDVEITNIVDTVYSEHKKTVLTEIKKSILDYQSKIQLLSVDNKADITKLTEEKKMLIEKYAKNSELIKLLQEQDVEKKKKEQIIVNSNLIKSHSEEMESKIELIKMKLLRKKAIGVELKKVFNEDVCEVDGVNFGIEISNNIDHERRILETYFDRRGTDPDFVLNLDGSGVINHTFLEDNVALVLHKIGNGDYKIKTGNEDINIAVSLFTVDREVRFYGEMDGDKIGGFSPTTMSQGKQSLFALRLILGSSNDKWPLLIDQPEDDLDARSIYDEIVPFLKKKKKERQIIMVSHNANLVVGGDTEEIIIANKHSTQRPNKNGFMFNYISGSIESSKIMNPAETDTLEKQGIREHTCEILDGGKDAFKQRKKKYHII